MPRAAAKPSFEIADANRVLPLVRSIVADIVANNRRMRELTLARHALTVAAEKTGTVIDAPSLARIKVECEELTVRQNECLHELTDLNVDLKDTERGSVDFACDRGGRTVLLCWELGEPSVAHWHGVEENFFDRRPLSTLPSGRTDAGRTESGGTKRAPDRRDSDRRDTDRRETDRRDGDAGPASA